MKKPYLIQRAKFQNTEDRTGIDNILRFDYMGSAEFEFGALPKSLSRVRRDIKDYVQFKYTFNKHPDKSVTVFCKKQQQEFIGDILEQLSESKIQLKERCDLNKFIIGNTHNWDNDFWWDIEQDWFFWKYNPDFELKFSNLIKK